MLRTLRYTPLLFFMRPPTKTNCDTFHNNHGTFSLHEAVASRDRKSVDTWLQCVGHTKGITLFL
jgi:hypothetical protein